MTNPKADRLIHELSNRFSEFPGTIVVDERQAVDLKIAQQVARDVRVAVFYDPCAMKDLRLNSFLISLRAFGFTVLDGSPGDGEHHGEWASELRAAAAAADVFVVPLLPSAFGIRYCDVAMGVAGVSKPLAVACISSMSVEQAREQLANREWATDARYAHLDMPALNLHRCLGPKVVGLCPALDCAARQLARQQDLLLAKASPAQSAEELRVDTRSRSCRERIRLGGGRLRQGRLDVVIHPEEIGGVVFLLDGGQARQIGPESRVDDLFGFDVERGKEMRVRGERAKNFFAGASPVAVSVVSAGSVH